MKRDPPIDDPRRRLAECEQRFQALFDSHPDALFLYDAGGRLLRANPGSGRLSGYTVDEILAKPRACAPVVEHARGAAFFQAAVRGEPQRFESIVQHKDGHRLKVWVAQIPIMVDGQVTSVLGIAREITEQGRQLAPSEEQRRQAERQADLEARAALLTPREMDVLRLLAAGETNPEIGRTLGLSPKAARNRVTHVLTKLRVADRTQAGVLAVELGLAAPPP
jgi:PAS domain S-box-containing protein